MNTIRSKAWRVQVVVVGVIVISALFVTLGYIRFKKPLTQQAKPEELHNATVRPVHIVTAVGDIACSVQENAAPATGDCAQESVLAAIQKADSDTTILLGDLQYQAGTEFDFANVLIPLLKKYNIKGFAVPGNHEYGTKDAAGYFAALQATEVYAGTPQERGYYSKKIGDWTLLALNSNCEYIGGCGPASNQYIWAKEVLQRDTTTCVIAAWHHPIQTSGKYKDETASTGRMIAMYELLRDHGVDVIVNGHDHVYERFAPLYTAGTQAGTRAFTIGTGGRLPTAVKTQRVTGSEVLLSEHGFLKLRLAEMGYTWEFLDTSLNVRDSGRQSCTK